MNETVKPAASERTLIMTALHYLSIVWKYRLLIAAITGATVAATVAFCVISIVLPPERSPLPNIYTAQATVLIKQGTQGGFSSSILAALGVDTRAPDVAPGFDNGALVLQVLKSRTFLDKVIEEFDIIKKYEITEEIKSSSRGLILSKSEFTYNRITSCIAITFTDINPVFARDVANRMVTLLNDWFAQNMGNSKLQEKKLLEEKVSEVRGEVTTLEDRLKNLQEKYGVLTAQDLGTSSASALAELRSQLIMKEIEIKNYATISAIEDPKLQQLKEERQNILDLINEQMKAGGAEAAGTGKDLTGLKSLPDLQLEFNHLVMELDVQRKIYNTLSHQYEVLKLSAEPDSTFQILELAEVPDVKSGPMRSQIVMTAMMVAFFASIGIALLLNSLGQLKLKRGKVTPRETVLP